MFATRQGCQIEVFPFKDVARLKGLDAPAVVFCTSIQEHGLSMAQAGFGCLLRDFNFDNVGGVWKTLSLTLVLLTFLLICWQNNIRAESLFVK